MRIKFPNNFSFAILIRKTLAGITNDKVGTKKSVIYHGVGGKAEREVLLIIDPTYLQGPRAHLWLMSAEC